MDCAIMYLLNISKLIVSVDDAGDYLNTTPDDSLHTTDDSPDGLTYVLLLYLCSSEFTVNWLGVEVLERFLG